MAKDKVKISKNEVDSNPPLFAAFGDPRTETIDPRELRYSNLVSKAAFAFGVGQEEFNDPGDPEEPSLSKLLPQLSDISIVSEEFDYSTTPATIKLKLKITDSTGEIVKGIRGRVPPL